MTEQERRAKIIAKLRTMSNAELDCFIAFMLRIRELPDEECKQLNSYLKYTGGCRRG